MILSKTEYIQKMKGLLPDNSRQEISPEDLRTTLIDLTDSVVNFLDGQIITADNFASAETRSTKAGLLTLDKLDQPYRTTVDNSAFGYSALFGNYTGYENTALGSHSLSCNLMGRGNTAAGFQSLAGNTVGTGNIGVGSFSLNNNKAGNLNIAIGHGAGYYHTNGDNYRFYLGSFDVNAASMCDIDEDPVTTGPAPLLFGDLNPTSHRLAIGTNELHDFGMLQVSGDVTPTIHNGSSLGTTLRKWSSINTDDVMFSGAHIGIGGAPSGAIHNVADARITSYGDIVPNQHQRYALGHPELQWDAYLNDVVISGQLSIFDESYVYHEISHCLYECKTLHLATSGFCDPDDDGFHNSAVCGFLNDSSLDGAGIEAHSSGVDYRRDYRFVYRYPDNELLCLGKDASNAYSQSRWESNISLEIPSGKSLITERVLGRTKLANVIQSGCMGVFIEPYAVSGQRVIVGQEPHVENRYPTLTDVNFISRSGTHLGSDGNPVGYDFVSQYATVDSGVTVAHRFASRIKLTSTVRGFSIVYHDDMDAILEGCLNGGLASSCGGDVGYPAPGGGGDYGPGYGPGGGGGAIVSPTVTIACVSPSVSNDGNTTAIDHTFTFTLSEAAGNGTLFETSDVHVTNGVLGDLTQDGLVFTGTLTVSNTDIDGEVSVNVPQSMFQDADGHGNQSSLFTMYYNEGNPPTVTITSGDVSHEGSTNKQTIELIFTLSEAVGNGTIFNTDDVVVTGGTKGPSGLVKLNDTTYTLVVSADSAPSQPTVSVAAGIFQDEDGNNNIEATNFQWDYETDKPYAAVTVLVDPPYGPVSNNGTTDGNPVTVTLDWKNSGGLGNDEAGIVGFVESDISINGPATISNFTQTPGKTNQWTFNFTANSFSTVGFSIAAGRVTDAAGNSNATTANFDYTYIS